MTYYEKNKDYLLDKSKKYYEDNKESIKEKMKEYNKKYWLKNKEKLLELRRTKYNKSIKNYYLQNKNNLLEKAKTYYENNKIYKQYYALSARLDPLGSYNQQKKISYRWAKPIGAGGDYPIQKEFIISKDITLYFN